MIRFFIHTIFLLCPFVLFGQEAVLFSNAIKVAIFDKTQNLKIEIFEKGIDTTQFDFIPVVLAHFDESEDSNHTIHLTDNNKVEISEVLLVSKKSKVVVGSYLQCLDGSSTINFVSRKYGVNTLLCRSENRLPYLSRSDYKKLNGIKKQGKAVCLLNFVDIGKKYVISNSEIIMEV